MLAIFSFHKAEITVGSVMSTAFELVGSASAVVGDGVYNNRTASLKLPSLAIVCFITRREKPSLTSPRLQQSIALTTRSGCPAKFLRYGRPTLRSWSRRWRFIPHYTTYGRMHQR